MPTFHASRFFKLIAFLALLVGTAILPRQPVVARVQAAPQEAQLLGSPLIAHDPVECVVEQQHPLFRAAVETPSELHTVKLYFHAQDYNDYYYVEMVDGGGDVYQASLPIAAAETEGFVYYIEAVDLSFNTSRTAEYVTLVTGAGECEDSEEGPPPVVVGSTAPGASAIPPGFAATGIERFISSTGAATGVGGGIGTLGVVAIGAGAAAGVTAGVLGGGNDDAAPEPAPPTSPPPTPGPPDGGPTPGPGPEPEGTDPVACFNTQPNPPVVDINEPVRFDASCSKADEPLLFAQLADKIEMYHWSFGDGRPDKEGRVVNHIYLSGGRFFARLTVTDSAGNEDTTEVEVIVRGDTPPPPGGGGGGPGPPPPPDADLGVSISGPGSGSVGTPFNFTVNVSKSGTLDAVNAGLSCGCTGTVTGVPGRGDFSFCGFNATSVNCGPTTLTSNGNFNVVITVNPSGSGSNSCTCDVSSSTFDGNSSNNSASGSVPIAQRSPDLIPIAFDTSFTSRLDVPPGDGTVRGQVVVNGANLQETNNTAPFRHQVKGQKGRNTVEARLVSGTGEGRWVFNFTSAPHFVAGSLTVESGQAIVQEASRIVFRVSPSTPPIRFRYRLAGQ